LATIQLTEIVLEDSMKLKGQEGWFEVSKEETEISTFTASHYLSSPKLNITFTEADREPLMALPEREINMLATSLGCEENIETIVSILLPTKEIKKVPTKKTTPKKTEE